MNRLTSAHPRRLTFGLRVGSLTMALLAAMVVTGFAQAADPIAPPYTTSDQEGVCDWSPAGGLLPPDSSQCTAVAIADRSDGKLHLTLQVPNSSSLGVPGYGKANGGATLGANLHLANPVEEVRLVFTFKDFAARITHDRLIPTTVAPDPSYGDLLFSEFAELSSSSSCGRCSAFDSQALSYARDYPGSSVEIPRGDLVVTLVLTNPDAQTLPAGDVRIEAHIVGNVELSGPLLCCGATKYATGSISLDAGGVVSISPEVVP